MNHGQGSNSEIRAAKIVEIAYELVATEGVGALTARRLATQTGFSTMVLYTHFGSVGGVAGAVCERAFAEFAETLEACGTTDDPLADMMALGLAYLKFANENQQLYTLMFQYTSADWAAGKRRALMQAGSPTDSAAGQRAFGVLANAVANVSDDSDPNVVLLRTGEVWSAVHGLAMLAIAGHLQGARDLVAESMFVTLAVGHGAERQAARDAMRRAHHRVIPR